MPPFRNSKYLFLPSPSPSSSSNAFQTFAPTSFQSRVSSERESDSDNTSVTGRVYKENHNRHANKDSTYDQYRFDTFHDQIDEVEEPCEGILSGCSIFSSIPNSQVCDISSKLNDMRAPFYKRKKISTKERCSIM